MKTPIPYPETVCVSAERKCMQLQCWEQFDTHIIVNRVIHSNELLAFLFIFAFITQSIATFVLYILTVLIHMLPFTLTIE